MSMMTSSFRRRAVSDRLLAPLARFGLACPDPTIDPRLNMVLPDSSQATGEGQHDRDEQRSEAKQPELRERFRQARLGEVHQQCTPYGTEDRHPATDRGVDHHLDRRHNAYKGRRHEPNFQREEGTADRRKYRTHAKREDLEIRDAIAGETDAIFLLAHRHQNSSELGQANELRGDNARKQHEHLDEIENELGVIGADVPAEKRTQVGDAVDASGITLLPDN